MSEWRTIDSAPKDGTIVDLWVVSGGYGERWSDCELRNGRWKYVSVADYYNVPGTITHWMPLPEPPSDATH